MTGRCGERVLRPGAPPRDPLARDGAVCTATVPGGAVVCPDRLRCLSGSTVRGRLSGCGFCPPGRSGTSSAAHSACNPALQDGFFKKYARLAA